MSMWRPRPDGGKDVTSVVLGKKEIPRGTLKGILELARVTHAEFTAALRKGRGVTAEISVVARRSCDTAL